MALFKTLAFSGARNRVKNRENRVFWRKRNLRTFSQSSTQAICGGQRAGVNATGYRCAKTTRNPLRAIFLWRMRNISLFCRSFLPRATQRAGRRELNEIMNGFVLSAVSRHPQCEYGEWPVTQSMFAVDGAIVLYSAGWNHSEIME